MPTLRSVSLANARRLAVSAQALDRPVRAGDDNAILELIRELGCLQIDPVNVVARTHQLVLFARVGDYDVEVTNRLAYERHDLFEYLAHAASLVPTSDLRIHRLEMMRRRGQVKVSFPPLHVRAAKWVDENAGLRRHVLGTIRREGPTRLRDIADHSERWGESGWGTERRVAHMIDQMWLQGRLTVAGRQGLERFWDLTERHLPAEELKARPSPRAVTKQAAIRSLRSLGIATPKHINDNFIRGRYIDLPGVLRTLINTKEVVEVAIPELNGKKYLMHSSALQRLAEIESGSFSGRTTLLSPFDNLLCDRARTLELFGFDYKIEIYTPPAKRRYGYYTMPLLVGDRLLGRVDPRMDRATATLTINAVHLEPGAPASTRKHAVRANKALARFLGAKEIVGLD